jgi:4-diphosphocytidyl-2-C-methyl-D-erythritol kinase
MSGTRAAAPEPGPVIVRTCAKVNLCLRVLGRRPDGYHEVQTIMQAISVWDLLRLAEGCGTGDVVVQVAGPERGAGPAAGDRATEEPLAGKANLCWRAATVFAEHTGARQGVSIELTKAIPIGAGLGGGSSDAAGTLAGLARLRGLQLGPHELEGMAAEIGSDVPFFLRGGCCLAQGRGERLEPLPGLLMWFVLVVPEQRVSTARAYAALTRPAGQYGCHALDAAVQGTVEALESGDLAALAGTLSNDFAHLKTPELAEARAAVDALVKTGCLGASISGSGTAAFGLAPSREAAERVAEELGQRWEWVRVVRTLGPGEGMVISDLQIGDAEGRS